jgi:hypothetical protein
VTWNCNGALRKKTKYVDDLNADIVIMYQLCSLLEAIEPTSGIARSRKDEHDGEKLWMTALD